MAILLTIGSAISFAYNAFTLISWAVKQSTKARMIQIINASGYSED